MHCTILLLFITTTTTTTTTADPEALSCIGVLVEPVLVSGNLVCRSGVGAGSHPTAEARCDFCNVRTCSLSCAQMHLGTRCFRAGKSPFRGLCPALHGLPRFLRELPIRFGRILRRRRHNMQVPAEEAPSGALQVMSPSAPAVHEESSRRAGAAYGSVGGLANGVSPAALPTSVPMLRHEAEYVNPSEMEGVLVTQEQMSGPGRGDLAVAEDAVVSAVQSVVPVQTTGASQASMEAAEALEDGSVHAMRADMDVRQGSSSLTVVRWISRLNDFLTAQGQSVLGSVGFNATPTQGPRHSGPTPQAFTPTATPTRSQQAAAAAARPRSTTQGSPLVFSPPEELPQGRTGPGWTMEYPPQEGPLFSREAWEHMMRFSQRAPWLYGRGGQSQGDSTTGSSEVQAEVQRQVDAMLRTQSFQLEEMREEISLVRAERARLLADKASRGRSRLPEGDDGHRHHGDPRVEQPRLPEGDDGHRHHGDPRGQPRVPEGDDGRRHHGDPRESSRLPEGDDGRRHHGDLRGVLVNAPGQSAGDTSDEGRRSKGVTEGVQDLSSGLLGESRQVVREEGDRDLPGGRNVRPRVGELQGIAGPPTVYGPSISATKCEPSAAGGRQTTASMTTSERLLETLA